MTSLFISYRRDDTPDTVKLLFERLKARLPRWDVFYDHQSIPPGEKFPEVLREKVTSADVVLVVLGPRWLELLGARRDRPADHVRTEVGLALGAAHTVIPVCVCNARMPSAADLAAFPELEPLRALNGRPIRPEPDFDTDLDRLVAYLEQIGPAEGSGTVLAGKYKLIRVVGEGGMGIVYAANQLEPRRTVAVKLVKLGMDSKEILARFDAERQALAVMDHPNIAQVLDAGRAAGGRPFFVMEFVDGPPITKFCDDHRVPPAGRLDLFRQVCEAVQHAHQKGIIHRDIKPSNVLVEVVDGRPVPKVIDFGLAKALGYKLTDRTLQTAYETRVGTLEYSSPEQAAGRTSEVDTRTDIYSLGVLLYELLAGAPPFAREQLDRVGEDEMRRVIREDDPPRPSTRVSSSNALPALAARRQTEPKTLTRLLRGELDWIVMKALDKEPARRYPTATALAEDVGRFLHNEPVSAARPSRVYRLRKFVRRNKAAVAGGVLVFLALVGGATGAVLGLIEARQQERVARQEKERADVEAQHARDQEAIARQHAEDAERRFNDKREVMETMLTHFGDKRLSEMPGSQEIRKELFERGLVLYENLFRKRQDDPSVRLGLAARYAELGRLQSEIATLDAAFPWLKKAETVLRQLVAKDPANADYKFRLGVVLYEIGYCCWQHRASAQGLPPAREAVQILASLADATPGDFDRALKLAEARTRLAALMTGWSPERTELMDAASGALRRLVAERPNDARAQTGLARVTIDQAFRARDTGAHPEAEKLFDEARRLAARAVEADATDQLAHTNLELAVIGLAEVYGKTGRVAKGVELMTEVVTALTRLATANPAVLSHPQALVWAHNALKDLYKQSGDHDKAVGSLQEIVRIADGLAQRNPTNVRHPVESVRAALDIAEVQRTRKREAEAAVYLDKVMRQADRMMVLHPSADALLSDLLKGHARRGEMSANVEQFGKARAAYQAGVDLFARYKPTVKSPGEPTQYHYLLCCQGLIAAAKGEKNPDEAIALARKLIVPIPLETFGSGEYRRTLLGELIGLSALLEDKGDVSEALRLRVRAVDEARALLGGDPKSNWYAYQHVFRSHHDLARMYGKAGDRRREFEELREYFRETEPYVHERDHSQLLAETAEFTPANLDRLRAEEKRVFGTGSLKRFTISADFDGVKQPVHVYVADSWQFLADQFTWVERVRGGKVPRDVVDSFRRVYDTARQRRVSYRDLCVYELGQANADDAGPADAQSPVARRPAKADPNNILPELAAAKQAAAAGGPAARRQLALRYARLAEDEVAAANYFRAGLLLDEARSYADLDALGAPRDPKDRDLLAYIQYVHGALLAGNGEPEKGYSRVLESFRTEPEDVEAGFALPAGAREFALGWISLKLQHPAESAGWYHKAMELGHGEAAERLYRACDQHPDATRALPSDLCKLLARAKASATNDDPAPLVFARLAAGGKGP